MRLWCVWVEWFQTHPAFRLGLGFGVWFGLRFRGMSGTFEAFAFCTPALVRGATVSVAVATVAQENTVHDVRFAFGLVQYSGAALPRTLEDLLGSDWHGTQRHTTFVVLVFLLNCKFLEPNQPTFA